MKRISERGRVVCSAARVVYYIYTPKMLKFAFGFVIRNRFVQQVAENEILKKFSSREGLTTGRRYFNQTKFIPTVEKSLFRPVFRSGNSTYKKPAILLGGILSFFGLEKLPEEPELILKMKKGILLTKKKKYDKAEVMLHAALELAVEEKNEDAITYIYDLLGNLDFEAGEHEKAEQLFVTVLQRLIARGEAEDSNKVTEISLKLARIFQERKDAKKAEQGYKFCLETLDKKVQQQGDDIDEDTLALWGMCTDWYARFLLITGRKSESLSHFKKAYDLCVKVNGMEHEQTVVLLNDLGTISSLMGDQDSAVTYLEQARDIGAKLPHMKDLAAIYINLGQLYFVREMYAESKKACQKGLESAVRNKDDVALSEANQCLQNIKNVLNSDKTYKLIDSQRGYKKAELGN